MGSEVIIVPSMFAYLFAVAYMFYSTRNRERLALIEKGAEASIFKSRDNGASPVWKIALLNLSLLFIGVGVGIALAAILNSFLNISPEVAYTSSIFIIGGLALLLGFYQSRKLNL